MSTTEIFRYMTLAFVILAVIATVVEKQYDFHAKESTGVDKTRALSRANLWSNISNALFVISALTGLQTIN